MEKISAFVDLLIVPTCLAAALILVFGFLVFIELWQGKGDDDRKGKK